MKRNNIKIVSVEFKKIKINKFLPKEKAVEFTIFFNDGNDKEIIKSVNLYNIDGVAENIINDIVNMEKNINKEFNGETLLENSVNVVVKNQEGLLPKINDFLKKVSEGIEKVRASQTANGYLDLVGKVNRMFLEF
jgi:methionyl-tRNA synthetase